MEFTFLKPSDEELLEYAQLPTANVTSIALRSTGYDVEHDEVLALACVARENEHSYTTLAHPQNVAEWEQSQISGGITVELVEEASDLYLAEDTISSVFSESALVIAESFPFVEAMLGNSWITLPRYEKFSLIEEFCKTHATSRIPDEPAVSASLSDLCAYYSIDETSIANIIEASKSGACAQDSLQGESRALIAVQEQAALLLACYEAFVQEFISLRDSLGAHYWENYHARKKRELESSFQYRNEQRRGRLKTLRMNAILWLIAFVLFLNATVQLYLRGADMSLVVIAGAAMVFMAFNWLRCLQSVLALDKEVKADAAKTSYEQSKNTHLKK